MSEKHLYEYAVVRVVPRVEREEFINVGVILFSKKAKFISFEYVLNTSKIKSIYVDADIDDLKLALDAFQRIARGVKNSGLISTLDIPERFRWITAVKSACIQTSRPHVGMTENLEAEVQRLLKELVL